MGRNEGVYETKKVKPVSEYLIDGIQRACDKAFECPEHITGEEKKTWIREHRWAPAQLRHNAATRVREEFGLEMAQAILGHQIGSKVTELYAEENAKKAREVMRKIG